MLIQVPLLRCNVHFPDRSLNGTENQFQAFLDQYTINKAFNKYFQNNGITSIPLQSYIKIQG